MGPHYYTGMKIHTKFPKGGMCQQILGELAKREFHENPFSDSRVITCGVTDRHNEANRHILQPLVVKSLINVSYHLSRVGPIAICGLKETYHKNTVTDEGFFLKTAWKC
jgi:hypothetical protein